MKILFITRLPMTSFAGTEKMLEVVTSYLYKKMHGVYFLNFVESVKNVPIGKMVKPFSSYLENVYVYEKKELPSKHSAIWYLFMYLFKRKISYEVDTLAKVVSDIGELDLIIVDPPYLLSGIKKAIKNSNSNAKVVLWNHGSISGMNSGKKIRDKMRKIIWFWLLKKWLAHADGVMAISSGIEQFVLQCNPDQNVQLVFNPIGLSTKKTIVKNSKKIIFVYVGRLEERQKNLSLLINALSALSEYSWKLNIYGDGPSAEKIKKYARSKNIEKKIAWHGFVENPFEKIEEATCLVMTSRFEGFPLVLVEAIERGLPVVSSDCPTGPSDIVMQNINGYLFKSEDEKELVKILRNIITGDITFKRGEEIVKTVNKYESQKVLDRIEEYLNRILL